MTDQPTNQIIEHPSRQLPWRVIGGDCTGMTPTEAFKKHGLDYETIKAPYRVALPDGKTIPSTNFALVRMPCASDPEPRILGTVSKDYKPLNNMATASALDELAKHLPLTDVASMRNDTAILASFRADNLSVLVNGKEDPLELYLLFIDNKMVGNGVRFLLSLNRIWCTNQLPYVLRNMKKVAGEVFNISLTHNRNAAANVGWVTDTLIAIASQEKAIKGAMQMLANKPIGKVEATKVFDAAFPMPEIPTLLTLSLHETSKFPADKVAEQRRRHEQACELASAYLKTAQSVYDGEVTNQGAAGNLYGALQAVTAVTNHYSVGARTISAEDRAEGVILGTRYDMTVRALDMAMALAK